ncbi:serine hydrolase domain-containing protein [Wenzhouxiangella sp. EGI_FJ10305]|uniref:serine hydrolase domain-containing protein n=1 Tax=Wenzhouxiangella sp. EGI_FJ10305 TaxID=3243768 RepID=UPI0035DC8EE9
MRILSILLIGALSLSPPSLASDTQSLEPKPNLDRLDALLTGLESQGFSGAVAAGFVGGPQRVEAYGLADREAGRAYRADTVQTMGSITKPMTAAAILVLVEQGDLAVDQTLVDHFDGVPAEKQGITLHQLLTHSAGFPGGIGPDNEAIGADEFLERAFAAELEFEPGSGYAYSNTGYSLLGILIERVSGQGYESFVREFLFEPLGMTSTGYLLPEWDESRRALGYRDGEPWGEVFNRGWREDGPGWHLRANGGLHTTVEDMRRWVKLLRGEGLLDAEAVARWTKGYVDEGGGDSFYAYGWAVSDSPMGKLISHNGGNGIYSADFLWFPERDFYLYIQGNSATVPAANLRPMLLSALLDSDFPLPPDIPGDGNPDRAERLAGEWSGEAGRLSLKPDGSRLIAEATGPQLLRALNNVPAEKAESLDRFDQRTRTILERIDVGSDEVLKGFTDEEMAARSERLIALFERFPEGAEVKLVGSLTIAPGGRFAEYGAVGSYIRIKAGIGTRIATVLWQDDGNYRGTALGPASDLPGMILVPTESGGFRGVERQPPWRQVSVNIEGDCLAIASVRLCREAD